MDFPNIESPNGVLLDKYLDRNKEKIRGYRVFYIISSFAERDVYKFGVHLGNTPHHRLNSYVISYGGKDATNSCKGCRLHYLIGTKYDERIKNTNTMVFKLEYHLKKVFKDRILSISRGNERLRLPFREIMSVVRGFKGSDTRTPIKRSLRNKSIPFKLGERVRAFWSEKDVDENGGRVGFYPATIHTINQESVRVIFDEEIDDEGEKIQYKRTIRRINFETDIKRI